MEEMSKKTKRLEKENLGLTRKQEAANKNILTMAEERTSQQREIELLRRQKENLEKLCRGMQAQGRMQVGPPGSDEEEDTDSEYNYDDEDESLEGDYEDDTEEEAVEGRQGAFGPAAAAPPPPPPVQQASANAKTHQQPNGKAVNGVRK